MSRITIIGGPEIVITGRVNANGTIAAGTGFSVVRNAAGNYSVTFTTAFANVPNVQLSADDVASSGTGVSWKNKTASGFDVHIADMIGGPTYVDGAFDFLAVTVT